MARTIRTRRAQSLAAVAATAALLLTGCSSSAGGDKAATAVSPTNSGSTNAGSTNAGSTSSAPLYSALPASIRKAGKINVGSSIDYPPFEYYAADGKTLEGFETEFGTLLETKLGVKLNWENADFDTLFTALRGNRYDIVYGAVNDTPEREKTFDFVDYLRSSQGFDVAKGNPKGIKTLDDLCGQSVAAVRGGIQVQFLQTQSGVCAKAGHKGINVLTFDGNSGEQLAVKEGRAVALLENYPTAVSFDTQTKGALEVLPDLQVAKAYYGMVLNKSNTQLRTVLQRAWQAIIDDGSYQKVLTKSGLSDIGIPKSLVNGSSGNSGP